MREYVAKGKERLDEIVYREYRTLDAFDDVLKANMHLAKKIELDAGDTVYLPEIKIDAAIKDEKALW